MPRQHLSLESRVVRGAIALVMLAVIGGAFLRLRDDAEGRCDSVSSSSREAQADEEGATGALGGGPPVVGNPAPDFRLLDLDGEAVALSELEGKVVLVNFWATWCRPCKKELPILQRLADERPDDLVVLAVNWQESAAKACGYFEENGLTIRVLLDGGSVYDQYRLQGLPDSFFVGRDGVLKAYQFGELNESKARERLGQAGLE